MIFSLDSVKPQFYYLSIGLKWLSSTQRCFHDDINAITKFVLIPKPETHTIVDTPQPRYNTIAGVQANFPVIYPIRVITRENV